MIKSIIDKNRSALALILIFIISEIIVNPFGNFPLNDDWTYGKSVMILQNEGKISIGDFPAMTLFSHLMWGVLFTKIFGFSFTVLRFSTLLSSLTGLLVLNKLVADLTKNKLAGFIICLVLLFNPLYFNLSNTFMTDVNFNTFLILSCYFAFDFFNYKNITSFILFFLISVVLTLMRQYGIIVPLCFSFTCLFLNKKKWLYSGLALISFFAVLFILKDYESYLKDTLTPGSEYKFSGDNHITQKLFWENFFINVKARYGSTSMHILLYSCPFVFIFIKSLLKEFKVLISFFVFCASFTTVYFLFKDVPFPIGNVFNNMHLGTETFIESMHPDHLWPHHTYSENMKEISTLVKYVFSSITLTSFILFSIKLIKLKFNPFKHNPQLTYLISLLGTYLFMLMITKSSFDRYHIPDITISLLLFSFAARYYSTDYKFAVIPLLICFYVSVFGTKDYLEMNRKRWEAYAFLRDKVKVDYSKINGGFEINSWNEGHRSVWFYFLDFYKYDYLIQYKKEKGFVLVREYEFQRYFPYKKDKINIFANEHKIDK